VGGAQRPAQEQSSDVGAYFFDVVYLREGSAVSALFTQAELIPFDPDLLKSSLGSSRSACRMKRPSRTSAPSSATLSPRFFPRRCQQCVNRGAQSIATERPEEASEAAFLQRIANPRNASGSLAMQKVVGSNPIIRSKDLQDAIFRPARERLGLLCRRALPAGGHIQGGGAHVLCEAPGEPGTAPQPYRAHLPTKPAGADALNPPFGTGTPLV
jgi:hypothetical protein